MKEGSAISDASAALETAPPLLDPVEAQRMTERIFGVEGSLTPLDSDRDQNYRVEAGRQAFVLKFSNPAEDPASVDFQTAVLEHLEAVAPELPVPRVVPTVDGATRANVRGSDGRASTARLLTFVPGRAVRPTDLHLGALHAYGADIARLGQALRGFFHPAAGRELLFDLKYATQALPMAHDIDDPAQRALAIDVLERFAHTVLPKLPALRAQVIHNDLTLENVLFDDAHRISGIVDFGDAVHTALVCDLSSALASLLPRRPDPAEAAAAVVHGYNSRTALEPADVALLPDLLSARLAMSAAWAAWRVRRYPDSAEYVDGMVDGLWPLLDWLLEDGQHEMRRALARPTGNGAGRPVRPKQPTSALAQRRRVFGAAHEALSYGRPFRPVAADGVWIVDADGRRCLDAYNNVPHVGHCHPRVVAAVIEQTRMLNTNTRYLHEVPIRLAERLTATTPRLDVCMLVNSGSEASDLAWQLATAYTGHRGALITADAYHGFTAAVADLSPAERGPAILPPHVQAFPAPDGYRGGVSGGPGTGVEEAIAALARRGVAPAACFADALFTSDGIFAPPVSYLQDIVNRVRAAGGLLVADEVQGGFGRTGTHMWSFQAGGIEPDIVVLGKPMGNGYPIGAVLTRSDIVERFARSRRFFSTFGGNPVAAAASLAVLDVLEEEGLPAQAADVGDYLRTGLEQLAERHTVIGDIRGRGLLLGVDLVTTRAGREPASRFARAVLDAMRERGVLVGSTGPHGNVLKVRPPMVFTRQHADILINALDAVLTETRVADDAP